MDCKPSVVAGLMTLTTLAGADGRYPPRPVTVGLPNGVRPGTQEQIAERRRTAAVVLSNPGLLNRTGPGYKGLAAAKSRIARV